MRLEVWQITPYQQAAEQMCLMAQQEPHMSVMDESGMWRPQWMDYAERMAELKLMIEAMRQNGIPL